MGAYAVEVVTSCQVLEMFCFSSFRGVMPSFLLMSARRFSLTASTWDSVWISSSTWVSENQRTTFRTGLSLFLLKVPTKSDPVFFSWVSPHLGQLLLQLQTLILCDGRRSRGCTDGRDGVFSDLWDRIRMLLETCRPRDLCHFGWTHIY